MVVHEITPIPASQETVGKVSRESKGAQECMGLPVNGTWQNASKAAGRACQHPCRDTLQHLWRVVEFGGSPSCLEKGKYYAHLQKQEKKEIWETTNESTSLEYLEKLWSGFSWKLFLGTKKKKATGRSQNIPQLTQPSLTVSSLLFASSLVPQRLWKHDLPHEDLGEEGIKENLQVSLCHV